jgi:hypothetical protein
MPLKVTCLCGYFCNRSVTWRSGDFDSYKWIQALKGNDLNKYALVPVNGQTRRLSSENLDDAIKWFGEMAVARLRALKAKGPFVVIPVPNSSNLTTSNTKPRTRKLAKIIVDQLADGQSRVLDCIRWKENLGSASSDGGPREAETLYKNVALSRSAIEAFFQNVPDREKYCVLLVDDVTTSGGHLKACAAKLKRVDIVVDLVICGGKTVYDQAKGAFDIREDEIEEYEP